MKIICTTMDAFFENIKNASLYNNTVWCDITKNPVDGNKQDAVKFAVNFQASAIKQFEGGGESLVEVGMDCGIDYHDASQDYQGTEMAHDAKDALKRLCEEESLILLPGILDM